MNICLFTNEEINKPLSLNDERAKHIIKILHKEVGQTFKAGIINQQAGTATITNINSKEISFSFTPESDGKPLFPLIMIIGFPRPIQLKRLLRDVAAIGVSQVHLTGTELGEKSYMQSNLVSHGTAYQMLIDGTVQAASTHVPELFLHQNLEECINEINKSINTEYLNLCLDNVSPSDSLQNILTNSDKKKFVAAIGSERGWTNNERNLLQSQGFSLCSMGSRVMRTETAATVSASIISSNAGWLN